MKERFTKAQCFGFLTEALAGMPVEDPCRRHGFRNTAFDGWRARFGGRQVDDARGQKALEAENGKIKNLSAESMLDVEVLRAALRRKH